MRTDCVFCDEEGDEHNGHDEQPFVIIPRSHPDVPITAFGDT